MKTVKLWFTKTQTYILLIVIGYCILVSLVNPEFKSAANFFDILKSASWMWILGLGTMLVLTSGGIDVSFTCVMVCGIYTAMKVVIATGHDNLFIIFAISIAVGAVLGMINALLIHFFKLPTLIVTLGTKPIFLGLMAFFVGTDAIEAPKCPKALSRFGVSKLFSFTADNGTIVGLSSFIIPVVCVFLLTWFIVYRTSIGRSIVALGNSEESAIRAGYNLFKTRMFTYIYVGALAGVAGVLAVSEVTYIAPLSNNMINGLEMTVIAAVVIGGTNLFGGEGTIFGTLVGILLVRLFQTTLIFLGFSSSWQDFFTGLMMLCCLIWTSLQRKRRNRRLLLFS